MDGGRLETELGIEHAAQAIETQRDQAGDVAGVAAGRGEADVDRAGLAIDAEEQKTQGPCAGGILCQILGEALEQARGGLEHVRLAQDRLEEGGERAIGGRRHDAGKRLGRMAQRLVEAQQQLALEARREGGAGRIRSARRRA